MRVAFLALLLVNLMFLAWAEWIDVPVLPPNAIAGLQRLQLVSEASGGEPVSVQASNTPAAPASASNQSTAAPQCVSVGPFGNDADVARASALLRSQQLVPRQRVTQSQPVRWYWVYLPAPSSAAQMNQVLGQLKGDGIEGAEPMAMAGEQRISLGMFQDQQLALRQQQLAVQKGFQPALTERLVSQPVYWLDLWVAGGTDTPPLQALKAEAGTPIGIQSCPPGAASAAQPGAPSSVSPRLPGGTAPAGPTGPTAPTGP